VGIGTRDLVNVQKSQARNPDIELNSHTATSERNVIRLLLDALGSGVSAPMAVPPGAGQVDDFPCPNVDS